MVVLDQTDDKHRKTFVCSYRYKMLGQCRINFCRQDGGRPVDRYLGFFEEGPTAPSWSSQEQRRQGPIYTFFKNKRHPPAYRRGTCTISFSCCSGFEEGARTSPELRCREPERERWMFPGLEGGSSQSQEQTFDQIRWSCCDFQLQLCWAILVPLIQSAYQLMSDQTGQDLVAAYLQCILQRQKMKVPLFSPCSWGVTFWVRLHSEPKARCFMEDIGSQDISSNCGQSLLKYILGSAPT